VSERCPHCGAEVDKMPDSNTLLSKTKDYFLPGAGEVRAISRRTGCLLIGEFVPAQKGAHLASRIHSCPESMGRQGYMFDDRKGPQ